MPQECTEPENRPETGLAAWESMLVICRAKKIPPEVIVRPREHMSDVESTQRRHVIQLMKQNFHMSVKTIESICPLTPQQIRKMVRENK